MGVFERRHRDVSHSPASETEPHPEPGLEPERAPVPAPSPSVTSDHDPLIERVTALTVTVEKTF
jgi:hypothetical protein